MVAVEGRRQITLSPSVQNVEIGHPVDFNCTFDEDPNDEFGRVMFFHFISTTGFAHMVVITTLGERYSFRNYNPASLTGRVIYVDKGDIRRISSIRITRVEWTDAGGEYMCLRFLMDEDRSVWYSNRCQLNVYGKYNV